MEDNQPLEQAPDQSIPAGAPDGITPAAPAPEVRGNVDQAAPRRAAIEKAFKDVAAKRQATEAPAAPAVAKNAAGRTYDPASGKYVPGQQAQPTQQATEAPKRAYPKSWKPELQPHWEKLPNEILEQIEKREADIFKGIEEYKKQAMPAELKALLGPREQAWTQQFGSVHGGLQQLLQLSDFAGRDPKGFAQWFMQQHRINLDAPQEGVQAAPEVAALQAELAGLKNQLQGFQQQSQQAALAPFINEVERFKSEPGHEHFEELRPVMRALLEAGTAKSLQEAYEQAVRAHPTHSQAWLAQQREAEKKQEAEKAQQARAAAVQVTGAPSQATPRPVDPRDRRAVLTAAIRNVGRA